MYIQLIRNKPQGNAITGQLVIDGRWFCNTMESMGYQIPALCYHVAVTMSPKFKRMLPLVCNVPRLPIGGTPSNRAKPVQYPAAECRTGIRFHRGTKPEHSTGCILVVADNKQLGDSYPPSSVGEAEKLSKLSSINKNFGGRSAADVEIQFTQLLLNAQQAHEDIILDVTDFHPGTDYGYDTPCPPELQKP